MTIQMKQQRTVSIPWMGKAYIELLGLSLSNLGLNVQLSPRTTDKTIRIGVRHSAEMMCFPYKPTLGNFVEALENGADTLLMYDSGGLRQLKHYWKIQEHALREMGYEFEMYNVNYANVVPVLKKLSGASSIRILNELLRLYSRIKKVDQTKESFSNNKPNIGIIGEIFTCCDERINFGIEEKIRKIGAKPVNTVTLSSFIRESFLECIKIPNGRVDFSDCILKNT